MVDHRAHLASLAKEFRQIAISNTEARFKNEIKTLSPSERLLLSTQLEATRRRLTRELRETLAAGAVSVKELEFGIDSLNAKIRVVTPE
jgi:hypothetical protein